MGGQQHDADSADAQVDVNVNVTDNTGTEDDAPQAEETDDNSVDTDGDEA